jgi:hypothetical protein
MFGEQNRKVKLIQHIENGKRKRTCWEFGLVHSTKSELSIENTLVIYKTTLKPIWTCGIPLCGTASNSNIAILQRYQNKVLRAIANAPWCISNKVLHTDLKVPTIREEITKFSVKFRHKITTHAKELASTLLEEEEPRRLKRFKPTDLTTRFS